MSTAAARPARDALATLALATYSMVVALGFSRVFEGWDFVADLALIVVVGHGTSFVLRQARVSGWVAVPLSTLAMAWTGAFVHYRDTLAGGLVPWTATWDQVQLELLIVRDDFPSAVAPVFYGAGWAPLATLAMILVVAMSDAFAFRAEARGEALVPGGVLFVFVAALGTDRLRLTMTALLIAAGVVTVYSLRNLHDRSRTAVLTARRHGWSLAGPAVLGTAVVIAVLAGFVGPRLPGADAEPLLETKGHGGTNFVANALIDIRSRLTDLGSVELFRVNATEDRYWRVMTLAEYTGDQFVQPSRPVDDLPAADPGDDPGANRIVQQLQILSLDGELVPAAADVAQASLLRDGDRLGVSEQPSSNALIAPDDLRPGDLFDIVSVEPSPSPDQLRAAGVGGVPDPIYLELPDDIPDVVIEQTAAVTAGAANPFDAAIALQSWFRDPNQFTYSLTVQKGHGVTAIESFFINRAGYCEQFAGTFAVMARVAGIPSRVAVGYTPGTADPDEPGWNTVIGKNAHAWPELWFDGIGWVAFEPTPGRGAPGPAEGYTDVAPDQDTTGPDTVGGTTGDASAVPEPTAPPTIFPSQLDPSVTTTVARSAGDDVDRGSDLAPRLPDEPSTAATEEDQGTPIPWRWLLLELALVTLVVAPAVVRRLRRARARHREPAEHVAAAWERATAAAADAGVLSRPSMTTQEWIQATTAALPDARRPMRSLAHVVEGVSFGPPGSVDLDADGELGATVGDDCDAWAEEIEQSAIATMTTPRRIKRYFVDYR